MNADGTNAVDLFTPNHREGYDDHRADWSPDGSKIVYSWHLPSHDEWVAARNADGTGEVIVSPPCPPELSLCQVSNPAWSPDGTTIAMWDHNFGLTLVDPDGQNLRVLTTEIVAAPDWQAA
jgi:Tol biopolymer transport system component